MPIRRAITCSYMLKIMMRTYGSHCPQILKLLTDPMNFKAYEEFN